MSGIVAVCAVLGCAVLGGAAPAIAAPAPAAVTPAPSITGITAITATGTGIFTLSKISCASVTICLALGVEEPSSAAPGGRVTLVWDGKSWTQLAIPAPATGASDVALIGLSCVKGPFCVAVGEYTSASTPSTTAAFAVTWTGGALKLTPALAQPLQVTAVSLSAVSCVTAQHCVAVGDVDATFNGADALLFETWDGTEWTARTKAVSPQDRTELTDVSCVTPTRCVTVGLLDSSVTKTLRALAILWSGSSITGLKVPEPAGTTEPYLAAVSCATAANCVAAGFDITELAQGEALGFTEMLDKSTWTLGKAAWPKGTTESLLIGVSCVSARYCVATGATEDTAATTVTRAAALVYNGTSWAPQDLPAPATSDNDDLTGVSCAAAASCVAIGDISLANGTTESLVSAFLTGSRWTLLTVN
jgi:hypothetical protein